MTKALANAVLFVALAASAAGAQRDTAFSWSRRLPDGGHLTIRNLTGTVEARPGTSDRVEVRATIHLRSGGSASEVTFDVREHGDADVEICTTYRGRSLCDPDVSLGNLRATVQYIVEIPKGLRFTGATVDGDVLVMQSVAECNASTGNGDIVIRESLGRASASSGNGEITVAAAEGPVRASTGNGRILVNGARGSVVASTGNGDIDARVIPDPGRAERPTLSFTTGRGSIRVALPADFNGEIDASAGNGRIVSDFEVRVQGRADKSRLRGLIGTGQGPMLKVSSGSGRVEIRKD